MLHARSALALVVVVVVTAAGCPPAGDGPPPPPPPEAECALDLNFDTSGSKAVTPGTPATGILCPAFDRDFFAVDVDADGTILQITLSMETGVTSASPAYKVLKDDGSLEGLPTPFSGEDPSESREAVNYTAAHRLDVAGRYFVVVQDARFVEDGFDIINPYSLSVALIPDPDLNEPNNDDDTATVQTSGATFTGQIATTGDEDWYAVDVPAGAQILDVTVTASGLSDVAHVASLFAADGLTELLASPLREGLVADTVTTRLRSRVDGGARAFLVVRDATGEGSQLDAVATYTVTLTVLANPDLNEGALGNDDDARTTALTSGAQIDGVLATTADQDLYRIAGGAGTSRANPRVLILTIEFDGVIDPEIFRPQVLVRGVDPEVAAGQQGCGSCAEADCDGAKCKPARLARFIDRSPFRTAFPLRDTESVVVVVNEFGDDAFQENAGYSIRAEVVDDGDPGEAGDDFLIPNLEFAGFANGEDLERQYDASIERARVLATSYPPLCDAGGLPAGCLPVIEVPEPIEGIEAGKDFAVDCAAAGAGPVSLTATGRLTYDGDRDYFRFDVPARSYFALNFTYDATGPADTPVELALFVHNSRGNVISNTLEAQQTRGGCLSTVDDPSDDIDTGCPDASLCVDGNCWADGEANATFSNHTFPGAGGECSFISPFDDPPYFLEIVDNGINDFDTELTYSFTVDVLCGCPDACEVGDGLTTRCQGMPDPT
ncbi:MAG: hypothetical protein Q8O67_15645 [Deltaproteobacteria bacterium]|nr:hypothetical protein [Deltaproteobacteria bacterium]